MEARAFSVALLAHTAPGLGTVMEPVTAAVLTWAEIVDHCSRLHTTRTRPIGPWDGAEMREASRMLAIYLNGEPAVVVPTRMHEPGFYVRPPNESDADWLIRSEYGLRHFQEQVEAGKVERRDGPF